ncbi:MAG TPA: STAS domain-containing protein [Candidatus Aquilonibacter sp.]|nr:STAS domain-containing protein [Candidatus Aquilonibacter sp.]
MRFSVSVRQAGPVTVVDIIGTVTFQEATALHETFLDLLSKGRKKFLLNLSNVTQLDSSGIGALARAFATVRGKGGDLKMMQLSKQVQRLLEITNLCTIFEDYSDEQSALSSFK